MDRLVDQAIASVATDDDEPADTAAPDDTSLADIESELYSSNREAGISAVGFGPVDDG
jgi:hypothetical protein